MRNPLLIAPMIAIFFFVATEAGAGSVSDAIGGVGKAISNTARQGARAPSSSTSPTKPVQASKSSGGGNRK
jgi:hypothetical protein